MKKNTIIKSAVSLAAGAVLLAGFVVPAFAQTTGGTTSLTSAQAARLQTIITRSNTEVAKRVTSLNALATRIGEMKNVPASEVSNISSEVQTTISTLNGIQAKVDADTTIATARADEKTIFDSVRVYALVIPQGYDLAASDRITTIVGLETALQAKLQTRISADQTAGKDVTALQTSYADITAKLADATTQAQAIETGVSSLVPDQGNATVAASNKAALVAARADVKAATADLTAARQDVKTIISGLKALE